MTPVDWSRPIEAVHEDGSVVRAYFANRGRDGIARVLWHPEDGNPHEGTFNAFGDALASWPWRIRNVQPTTPELDPALWDRMVALVRRVADIWPADEGYEARAIVADLPKPVDPDLIEARRLACESSNWDRDGEHWLNVMQGKQDHTPMVRAALAGIKHGRKSTPEVSHVG